jgi:Ribosomal protein L4
MKLKLLNIEGTKSETVEISDKVLNLKINHKLIKYVIDWQLNHMKPRTAKTKTKK